MELCCASGNLEQYPIEENPDFNEHGDVCRDKNGADYTCPTGCVASGPSSGPYCAQEGTSDSPCRVEPGKDCAPSGCPTSHPYLDFDGRAEKFDGQHGDVCRNPENPTDWACPEGCDYSEGAPYCADAGTTSPCRI